MEPDLDVLLEREAEAAENLSQAYIKFSVARSRVQTRLTEIREAQPTLFTQDKDS